MMQICLPGGSDYFEVLVSTFSISAECMDYFQGSWLHILCGWFALSIPSWMF